MSVLQSFVLLQDISVLRQPCDASGRVNPTPDVCHATGRVCSTAASAAAGVVCYKYRRLPLNVPVLQHPVLPKEVCLFYIVACATTGQTRPKASQVAVRHTRPKLAVNQIRPMQERLVKDRHVQRQLRLL